MRHQSLSKHFLGNLARFARRFHDMHAAFESVCESSLPAAAGVDLRFDHDVDLSKLTRDRFRLIGSRSNFSACRRNTELVQELLRLILVNIHLGCTSKALK